MNDICCIYKDGNWLYPQFAFELLVVTNIFTQEMIVTTILSPEIFILASVASLSHPYVSGEGKKIWYEGKNVSIGALDRSVPASVNRTNRIKERISCFKMIGVNPFLYLKVYFLGVSRNL